MEIVNKVAQSGLLTIDLKPTFRQTRYVAFDLKSFLSANLF